jgi:hypothetical protein
VFAFKLEWDLKTAFAWRLQIEIHFMMSFKLSNESQTRNISPSCTCIPFFYDKNKLRIYMVWSDTDNDICDRKFYTKRMEIDIVMDG